MRTPTLCCLLLLLNFPGAAQSGSENKGKQVIDQAVAALGGDRFLNMRYRIASGRIYSFFHDQLNGLDLATIYTEYLETKPVNGLAVRERERLGKKQDYSYLFLADQGWDVTYRGARPIPDDTWDKYVRTTENDILYLLRTRYTEAGLQFDYVGTDVYVSTHVEIVDVTDSKSQTVRVYVDHNTHLPIRESFEWFDSETKQRQDQITDYSKYRNIGDGITWPFSIERQRNGYKIYQLFANKVTAGGPMPPATFELPSSARVLKKVN